MEGIIKLEENTKTWKIGDILFQVRNNEYKKDLVITVIEEIYDDNDTFVKRITAEGTIHWSNVEIWKVIYAYVKEIRKYYAKNEDAAVNDAFKHIEDGIKKAFDILNENTKQREKEWKKEAEAHA